MCTIIKVGDKMPVSTPSAKAASSQAARSKTSKTRPKRDLWKLRLYVIDETPRSVTAFNNLYRICEKHLPGRYEIQVVDLFENPQLARDDQILTAPTLIRQIPPSHKKLVGDLSNTGRVLACLGLLPAE